MLLTLAEKMLNITKCRANGSTLLNTALHSATFLYNWNNSKVPKKVFPKACPHINLIDFYKSL